MKLKKIEDFNKIEIGDSFMNDYNIYYVIEKGEGNQLRLFAVGKHNLKGIKETNPLWITFPGILKNMNYVEGIR